MTLACEDANSKLVEVVTVADVDSEDHVGNSFYRFFLILLKKVILGKRRSGPYLCQSIEIPSKTYSHGKLFLKKKSQLSPKILTSLTFLWLLEPTGLGCLVIPNVTTCEVFKVETEFAVTSLTYNLRMLCISIVVRTYLREVQLKRCILWNQIILHHCFVVCL